MAVIAGMLGFVAGVAAPTPAFAQYASGGNGLHKGAIDWFEWGVEGTEIPAQGISRTNNRNIGGQILSTTCAISGLDGRVATYRSGTFTADTLDDMYNVGGTGTANQMVAGLANLDYSGLVSFHLSCSVALDGAPVPLAGLVMADAEVASISPPQLQEFVQAKPDQSGATWRIVDRYRSPGCSTESTAVLASDGTLRLTPNGQFCASGPGAVAFMQGATSAQMSMQGGGISAIAMGVVLDTDFGDAPQSYGAAGSMYGSVWQGGTVPQGTTSVSNDQFGLATLTAPPTRLGAAIDSESAQPYSANATGDGTDEDAISISSLGVTPGSPFTLPGVQCQGPGFVSGWVDWNGNGVFDAAEASVPVSCTGPSVALTWNVPLDAVEAQTFLRVRISSSQASASSPTGLSLDGEVEDYAVNLVFPSLDIEKTSDATVDSRPGDAVTYTVTATNNGASDFTAQFPAVVVDDLTNVLDDADYNADAVSDRGAAPSYAAPQLRWSGALPQGESVSVTYTATLKKGGDTAVRNVAWEPVTPDGTTPPACAAPPVDASTGESCDVVDFGLPRLAITKTADRSELPAAGQVVTYTVQATNTGQGDYTSAEPAVVVDDLTDVIDDATFDEDSLSADRGATPAYDEPLITWADALSSGESVSLTYQVTYTAEGDQRLINVAFGPIDPDDPGPTPVCDPADQNGLDPETGLPCDRVNLPGAALSQWKTVTSSADEVTEGTVLTYTLHFENTGEAAATVDAFDLLAGVTDDADVSTEPTGANGVTASRNGDVIAIDGSVAPGETATVTYAVTVKATSARGDNTADNFLVPPTPGSPGEPQDPPADCQPENPQRADCTSTPIASVTYRKTVAASATPVVAGTELTYTITIENIGSTDATVSRFDDLSGVLDDATLGDAPESDTGSVLVSEIDGSGVFEISGTLDANDTATVTYTVLVNDEDVRGDDSADNFLVEDPADPRPSECVDGDDQCTSTPLPRVVASKSVDPASGTSVEARDQLTYTLVFTNEGQAAGPVEYTDYLAQIVDDATVALPTTSDPAVTAQLSADDTIVVGGTLQADQTVTVSYAVTVLPDSQRDGDNDLGNFLVKSGDEPPATDAECATGSSMCTENPVGEIDAWKSVQASETPVKAGTILTYTLHFESVGNGDATVEAIDDLGQVVDDADVTSEPVSDTLTVGRTGNEISIGGQLAPGETATVTYQVTIKQDADRANGDDLAANFLLTPGDDGEIPEPPVDPACQPTSAERPDCTITPIGRLLVSKSVEASSDPIVPGAELTYTLTFDNQGEGPIGVDKVDDLSGVLDDATVEIQPTASDDALEASEISDDELTVIGQLDAGQTVTVTYSVTVNDEDARGDNIAANFVLDPGQEPPVDGECPVDSMECTSTPLPRVTSEKSVDPASGSTVISGDELTYTLTFMNDGEASGAVDYIDYLTQVLDDASVTIGPESSSEALIVTDIVDGVLAVSGMLEVGQVETVTYTVRVNPDGERGDNRLSNFLLESTEEPPGPDAVCEVDEADCTTNPVPEIVDSKSVDPTSTTTVSAGRQLTYTLTFTNVGQAEGEMDRVDDLTHVLDDAHIVSEPIVSDDALEVIREGARISITGSLEAGATVTVSYTVEVNPAASRGDDILANFLLGPEEEPPAEPVCEGGDHCTVNPVEDPPALASTGSTAFGVMILLGLTVLLAGGALMILGRRRREAEQASAHNDLI